MGSNFKNKGFTTVEQHRNYGNHSDTMFHDKGSKGFQCPVCGKLTKGYRPEGYMHPKNPRMRNVETTYCKPKEIKDVGN